MLQGWLLSFLSHSLTSYDVYYVKSNGNQWMGRLSDMPFMV
jgi:hypothetical protein